MHYMAVPAHAPSSAEHTSTAIATAAADATTTTTITTRPLAVLLLRAKLHERVNVKRLSVRWAKSNREVDVHREQRDYLSNNGTRWEGGA